MRRASCTRIVGWIADRRAGSSTGGVRVHGPAMSRVDSRCTRQPSCSVLDPASSVPARYLAKLLAALAQEDAAPAAGQQLHEPVLSERELEVLALIASGESNQEIASKLFITLATVKTHINNLYRKLGARSRTQAVARGREMNLL